MFATDYIQVLQVVHDGKKCSPGFLFFFRIDYF